MTTNCLCVGGPLDGQEREISVLTPSDTLLDFVRSEIDVDGDEIYYRERVARYRFFCVVASSPAVGRDRGERYGMLVYESLSPSEVLRRLIDSYCPSIVPM